MKLQVLVACKQPVMREGLVHLLNAGSTIEARPLEKQQCLDTARIEPQVVLNATCETPSLTVIAELREAFPQARTMLLLLAESDTLARSALRLGIEGVAGWDVTGDELKECLHQLAEGQFVISNRLARRLALMHATADHGAAPANLTEREVDVLRLLADGCTNRDIAEKLSLSEHTVRAHLRVIMQKLQVSNRVQAAARAWQGQLATTNEGAWGSHGNSGRRR
jgi:DNA-binding NarL/FixJ family response regulator